MAIHPSQAAWALQVVAAILPFVYGVDNVLDIMGQPVVAGTEYNILPVNGGGLPLQMRNNSCPANVAYNSNKQSLPVVFTPYEYVKEITENVNLKVEFSAITVCAGSTRWRLTGSDWKLEKNMIYVASSCREDWSYFRISKSEGDGRNVYELSFCPTSLCSNCRFSCGSLGIYADQDGNQWLVKDNEFDPLKLKFKRA